MRPEELLEVACSVNLTPAGLELRAFGHINYGAGVVEAVDTEDLKSSGRKAVRVRVPPPAHKIA